ncbi:tudor domain-containing protein 7B-like isoform X1 [Brienomyrus brachyistius]|uniref:tudor domain-containing protein 7B-like isoform X1 n=2 Tax=Brienomyrus brachyistius TaxID=42636 RepID=UPI0020B456A6|nr:tudor domain-containing protein 7B-like isoform X1 [Brienomyrus brachyistius]
MILRMSDVELLKKMLRAVLQSNKNGVSLSRLQSEYKSLTGEFIPHKQMGYPSLDSFLNSMPSVVKMERSRTGEVVCFAAVCKETAHIAQLVARQRNAKKAGRPLLVNCQMRVKPATPFTLNAKPRTSLRQPDHMGHAGQGMPRLSLSSRLGGPGDFRQVSTRDTQHDGRLSAAQNKAPPIQIRKPPIPGDKYDKKITLPVKFQKEVNLTLSRNLQQTSAPSNINQNVPPGKSRPLQSSGYNQQLVQNRLRDILNKYSNGFWVSKLPQLYRELYKQELPTEALKDLEQWSHVCMVEKPCSTNPAELLLYPAKEVPKTRPSSSPSSTPSPKPSPTMRKQSSSMCPGVSPSASPLSSPPSSPVGLSPDIKVKLGELLAKYSNGLWANALPKLFQETYKIRFPEHVLDDLSVLEDICTVDYPMPDNLKKAILYPLRDVDENRNRVVPERMSQTTQDVLRRPSAVPPLLIPKEEYPSVLVVEVASTDSVTLRFIGKDYSQAQETLEDEMREFYGQDTTRKVMSSLAVGQLAAVKAEEEEEFLRAQVCEVMGDKAKVYYVDHGFSEVINTGKLLDLHPKFFRLPFQATKCKLAGLEPFCQEPPVIKKFETMACGKILLAEILERGDTPLVVLYDTSQDDDVNINTACMRALQDKSLENTLKVNGTHMHVSVTNVCSDGTVYCQLSSRGLAKLTEMLEKIEAYFHSQVTSEFLVSRPFCGKFCLARYKGKWSRVEITNLHGSRVLDIQFVDVGVPASVEVIELREVPPPFLRELVAIPPQALKCSLAGLPLEVGSWTPDAVLWLRDAVLGSTECSIKIAKVDEAKRLVHIYLFTSKDFHDTGHSVNQQVADMDLWKHQKDVFLGSCGPAKKPSCPATLPGDGRASPQLRSSQPAPDLQLPPLLELPPLGQNIDMYVSVACHPGHFVLQPWKDQYKLVVLMGEMILYYNKTEERPVNVEKNQIYAAKVENNWHRVLVKGILTNGLVSVYELDYGKHELVSCTKLQPLISEFRQLPFQGITAQLAGVKPLQWSEEASMVFRNHVEKKALVAQIEVVHEAAQPWDRKVVAYLVDTSQEDRDIWVHDLMSEFAEELTKPA